MTNRHKILRDLLTSPSSACAISDHTDIPEAAVLVILKLDQAAGLVESRKLELLAQCLTVWSLTAEGCDIAKTFPLAPKEY